MSTYTASSTSQRLVNGIILLLFFAVPLTPVSRGNSLYIYIPQIIFGLITIYFIVRLNGRLPIYIAMFWAFGIIMFLFGSVSYSGGILSSVPSGLRLLFPAMFLTIGYSCHDLLDEKKIIRILLVLLLIELLFSILPNINLAFRQVIGELYREDTDSFLYGFRFSATNRAIGSIGNPNLLCLYVIVISSIILFRIDYVTNRHNLMLKMLSLICTVAICILTQSREGILIFLIVLFIYLYSRYPSKKTTLIAIPLELIIVYVAFSFINKNISRSLELEGLTARFEIWNDIINKTLGDSFIKYLFGIGYQNARSISFFDNIYLKILVSGGFLGLVFFIICMFLLLKKCINYKSIISFVLLVIWIVSSLVCEFQETIKLSSIAIFSISYYFLHNSQVSN